VAYPGCHGTETIKWMLLSLVIYPIRRVQSIEISVIVHLSQKPNVQTSQNFILCYLWLSPPLITMPSAYFQFVDDIMFSRNWADTDNSLDVQAKSA